MVQTLTKNDLTAACTDVAIYTVILGSQAFAVVTSQVIAVDGTF